MPVLRDKRGGIEGGRGTEDGAEIVGIGNLVENYQRAPRIGVEHFGEVDVLERLAVEHQALMGRVARDQAGEVGGVGVLDREIRGQLAVERGDAFARGPQLAVPALGILQGRLDRMAAPQADVSLRPAAGAATTLHPPRAPAQVLSFVLAGH